MSGVNPLVTAAAALVASSASSADAALELGAIAQLLQAQLSVGDLLEATVLPPKNGQDLIELLGQTVVAQLPPDLHPGDHVILQVTGFQGNQILVRNLGLQDSENPLPVVVPQLPADAVPGNATLTTIVAQPQTPAQTIATQSTPPPAAQTQALPPQQIPNAPVQAAAAQETPPVAPPREVFVAASVVRNTPLQEAQIPQTEPQQAESPPPQPQQPQLHPEVSTQAPGRPAVDIESRIAATRAATAEKVTVPPTQPQTPTQLIGAKSVANAPVPAQAPPPTLVREAILAARPIDVRRPAPGTTVVNTQPAVVARATNPAMLGVAIAAKDAPRILQLLNVPQTPVTIAAARTIASATTLVSTALQNLDRALSGLSKSDGRLAVIQTLSSFTQRIDAANPQTLPAQISSFVSNVVQGAEAKIVGLLHALRNANAPVTQNGAAATAEVHASAHNVPAQISQVPAPPQTPVPGHAPLLSDARAAERQVAISHDLKSTIAAVLANPPPNLPPHVSAALSEALTALTATQLATLGNMVTDPRNITLSLPLYFYDGGAATQLRISRERQSQKNKIDADNFHIAFILDTKALGTLAIDLNTVGRAVNVSVKTDRSAAVPHLRDSIGELRDRLQDMRYRVASTSTDYLAPKVPDGEGTPVVPRSHDGVHVPAPTTGEQGPSEARIAELPHGLDLQA